MEDDVFVTFIGGMPKSMAKHKPKCLSNKIKMNITRDLEVQDAKSMSVNDVILMIMYVN